MRILLTANGSPWTRNKGGGTLAVHHLATAFSRRGHEVTVLYGRRPKDPHPPGLSYSVEWAKFYQVATINLNIFSFGKKIKRLIETGSFDLVHGNAEEALFAPTHCRKAKIPFFYTSHANFLPSEGLLQSIGRPLRLLKSVNTHLERATAQSADLVFTFSEFSKNLVVEALDALSPGKVKVVSPGVSSEWYEVKREKGQKKQLILWGRMADQKGIPELLQAFKIVREYFSDIKLLLVGEGALREEYMSKALRLGISEAVSFEGWKDEATIRKMASESLAGVFPSRIESFGLAIAEAMATGLPVIATRVGALPEFIINGKTGNLVAPGNIEELAAKLIECISDPDRMEMFGAAAKIDIRKKFCWDNTAEIIENEYDRIIKKRLEPGRR
ncbi:MAG: glycosyltransferase family 4 protein [Candidatus Nitronauta litoralis]|uniref:Glycosyltransferase family 4 protein n=1 Tax=Candidatus Nitronauta litoralis TaxID=2705533 RepID=A0A7T0BZ41_9BACT|nr:MAG: glycosyltransferase family 4 protein [Candidatus Nitronauta litoralis]